MSVLTTESVEQKVGPVQPVFESLEMGAIRHAKKVIEKNGFTTLLVPGSVDLSTHSELLGESRLFSAPSGAEWIVITDPAIAESYIRIRNQVTK